MKTKNLLTGLMALGLFGLAVLALILFFVFQVTERDTRVTLINSSDQDVRVRMLQSDSGIESPYLSASWVLRAGKQTQNHGGEGCLFVEDEQGSVIKSIALGTSMKELLQLAPGTQRVIDINEPHPACRINKEDAKSCYLGKGGYVPVEDCP